MSLPRFYVDGSIDPGKTFALPEAPAHHLARVLRKEPGEEIVVFNGLGGEFVCLIESVKKSRVEVTPKDFYDLDRAAKLDIWLGLCVLKKDSMDSVLAKVTELGVTRITPIISDHCTVAHKVIRNREAHWQQVIIAACEQCGLNRIPEIDSAMTFESYLPLIDCTHRLIAVPNDSPMNLSESASGSVALITGPEGGFSGAEEQAASDAAFNAITFGSRILRAETAPIVALSVVHQVWGDFGAY